MISLFETYLNHTGNNIDFATVDLMQIQNLIPEEFLKWQDKLKWEITHDLDENNSFYSSSHCQDNAENYCTTDVINILASLIHQAH